METQTGVTFALGFDMGAGQIVDYDDDKIEVQGATIGDVNVSATFAGWTLTFDQNGIDNLFDGAQQEDMKISGSVGGATIAFVTDLEANTNSYSLGYTVGDLHWASQVKTMMTLPETLLVSLRHTKWVKCL